MSRLERLINLTATLLHADRHLTRDELVERVPGYGGNPESVRRAFERDKDTLREMGVPVHVAPVDPSNPDSPTGYRVRRDDYYLPDPGLEPDELAALHLAARTVRLPGAEATEALWKLGGMPSAAAPGEAAGLVATQAELPGSVHLVPLFQAWSERRTVSFSYRGAARTVDPWRLGFRTGHWYLLGFDHGTAGERNFRLDRIEEPISASEPGAFARPDSRDVGAVTPPWLMGEGDPVTATVLVDADQAGWVTNQLGPESVVERRDGGAVVVAVPVTNPDAFRSFVLGFLDRAEVLAPPALRDDMIEWLEALCRP